MFKPQSDQNIIFVLLMRYLFRTLTASAAVWNAVGASDMQGKRMETLLGGWGSGAPTEILTTLPTCWEGGQVSSLDLEMGKASN